MSFNSSQISIILDALSLYKAKIDVGEVSPKGFDREELVKLIDHFANVAKVWPVTDFGDIETWDINETHRIVMNSRYRVEFFFFPDAKDGPRAYHRFDYRHGTTEAPLRVQYAPAVDGDHARKIALCFLRHWSSQHADSGTTGVVPSVEMAPDAEAA